MLKTLALISVYQKQGIETLARALQNLDMQLVSTGQTKNYLQSHGLKVLDISELTGEPERFGGRVKTLHHKVLGGILMRPGHDEAEWPYDFRIGAVVCNFYPFAEKASQCSSLEALMEWVDIGGPTMVRAAAKNYEHVWVFTRQEQISRFVASPVEEHLALRRRLSLEAFMDVAALDHLIVHELISRVSSGEGPVALRYGENAHQKATFTPHLQASLKILGDCSFNNIRDAEAALRFVKEFRQPAVCVIKHQTLCGAAVGEVAASIDDVFELAWAGDTLSRFGGVIGFNQLPGPRATEVLKNKFVELVLIPRMSGSGKWAEQVLQVKPNLRIVEVDLKNLRMHPHKEIFVGALGQLTQQPDTLGLEDNVLQREELWRAMGEWSAACSKSNAMVLCGFDSDKKIAYLAGAGQGQPNRVEALRDLAIPRAQQFCQREGVPFTELHCFSDAFLPFEDSLLVMHQHGLQTIFQPGGSKRDGDIQKKAGQLGIRMVMTGKRHFWH